MEIKPDSVSATNDAALAVPASAPGPAAAPCSGIRVDGKPCESKTHVTNNVNKTGKMTIFQNMHVASGDVAWLNSPFDAKFRTISLTVL